MRWQRYGDTWHQQALRCAGCASSTHDPGLFGWSWVRDASGYLIARCRKCLPIAVTVGGTRAQHERAEAEEDDT